jgi:hypothetical protein
MQCVIDADERSDARTTEFIGECRRHAFRQARDHDRTCTGPVLRLDEARAVAAMHPLHRRVRWRVEDQRRGVEPALSATAKVFSSCSRRPR